MNSVPTNNMDVKKQNRINTLRCLLKYDRISQPELAQKLNLSWPTVLQNVKELINLGLVHEVGAYKSTGGRKAKAYASIPDAKLAIGVDITKNHIGFTLVDLSGMVIRYTRKTRAFSSDENYFKNLGDLMNSFLKDDEFDRIIGVGISIPGIISDDGKKIIFSNALDIYDFSTEKFVEFISYPCLFINDANAAGFAEMWDKSDIDNLIYLSLSNTVGGAIIFSGKLFWGNNLRAGEFGHNTLVPNGKQCYCGKKGCLDAYISAKVLSEQADGNLAMFFEKLRCGNAEAEKVWDDYLKYLAIAINNLRMTFDCDIIAGGYVGAFLEEFARELKNYVAERNTFESNADFLKYCTFKLEASAVGAALMKIDSFLQEI